MEQTASLFSSNESGCKTLYLDLMKTCLNGTLWSETYKPYTSHRPLLNLLFNCVPIRKMLSSRGIELVRRTQFDTHARDEGREWPASADTMIGRKRLDNLEHCIVDVLQNNIPGDLIETGVWRGGASILMRAVLKAYGDTQRTVWLADSFRGLPRPNETQYPADKDDGLWKYAELAVSEDTVKSNFLRYGLLDDQVRFLVGWFRDTLPTAPFSQLAVMRLDGDMYESTMDALTALYPKLSPGGYVIVDDYGSIPACRQAVRDFRNEHLIDDSIRQIDWTGVYWQRSG